MERKRVVRGRGLAVLRRLPLWKLDPNEALRAGARSQSPHTRTTRARRLLVTAEISLALTLLIGAGLTLKSAWRLSSYPVGFQPNRILKMKVEFSQPPYADSPSRQYAIGSHSPHVEPAIRRQSNRPSDVYWRDSGAGYHGPHRLFGAGLQGRLGDHYGDPNGLMGLGRARNKVTV